MKLRSKTVWGGKAARHDVSGFSWTVACRSPSSSSPPHRSRLSPAQDSPTPCANTSHPNRQRRGRHRPGSDEEVTAIAARHGLRIKKLSTEGAVLEAKAAEIEALSAEVDHLSRDVEVRSFMSVTNEATGADQVWAGVAGCPGFTGAGIGIALIDSGVWTGHRSLAGRVVYAKDFVGDDNGPVRRNAERNALSNEDPYGHGTHIGAIIAGNSPYPAGLDRSDAVPRRGAWRQPHQPARHRRRRHRQGEQRDRGDPLGHPEPRTLQHPRHQPVARRAGRGVLQARPACARLSSAPFRRASSSWRRRAIGARTPRGAAFTAASSRPATTRT